MVLQTMWHIRFSIPRWNLSLDVIIQLRIKRLPGMHDLDKNYQNSEQMLVNQRANEHGHGDQQPESEQMLLNNEEAMLKQDAEEQVENEQLLPHPATDVNHRIKEEQMLLDDVTVVHDLDHCDLNRFDGVCCFC